ncbi:MAG: hypothetical protein COA79_00600 [Planctomycetota bacterium]|nr:MAG: hypothetical protein COA79_00600 [Planctomycetota bacterium]
MEVSGKIVAFIMIGAFAFFVGGGVFIINTSKGREYNREITIKEQMKKVQLKVIQKFISDKKKSFSKFSIDDLNKLCGPYEFIYFPENIKTEGKPFILTKEEIIFEFKKFDGELSKVDTSIGFYVMFGDTFEVKTYSTKDLKNFLDLERNDDKNTYKLAEKYYRFTFKEAAATASKVFVCWLLTQPIKYDLVSLPLKNIFVNFMFVSETKPEEAFVIKKDISGQENLGNLKKSMFILLLQSLTKI